MKSILIRFSGHSDKTLFDPHARDNVNDPYIFLRDRLRDRGYELTSSDHHPIDRAERFIFWDVPPTLTQTRVGVHSVKNILAGRRDPRDLAAEVARLDAFDRSLLILGEPVVVSEQNWRRENHERFPRVLVWHDDFVDGHHYFKFRLPVPRVVPSAETEIFRRKKLLVNISGNKHSHHPDELYSARRATIRYFEKSHPDEFDLYGTGWNSVPDGDAPYQSYRGTVRHKFDVLGQYRFSICYENARRQPGYVTEKILDCLRAGVVPIYWGAPNIDKYVEPGAFIDRAQFRDDADLADFLLTMPETQHKHFLDAASAYLNGPEFREFLPDRFADAVIGSLDL